MPESQNLELFGHGYHAIVDIVADACKMKAAHAQQADIPSTCSDLWLRREKRGSSFKFLSNGIRRFRPVEAPPGLSCENLSCRKRTDLNLERLAHSRLRSSPRTCAIGIVSPRSH